MKPTATTPTAARRGRWAGSTRLLGAVSMLALCGIAQAQDLPLGVTRLVINDAARLLNDRDPEVRGEALLIVAGTGSLSFHSAVQAATGDADAGARGKAILALGLLATPGTAVTLDALLADGNDRSSPDGVAAAFALGLLPPDHAPSVVARVLTGFLHGSRKKQQEPLMALLLGLSQNDGSGQAAALRRLFDDDATRDPQVRAQLLHLLLRTDRAFDGKQLRRLLDRGCAEERTTLLRWLGSNDVEDEAGLLPSLDRAAKSSEPALRTAALAALTRRQYLPALELAAKAMRSTDAAECGQGVRSLLAIGGASMRGAIERDLLGERDAARKAALLASFDAPPSSLLLDHAAALAADASQPFEVRTAAVTLLDRSDPTRTAVLLRDLFRSTTRTESLPRLAALLLRDGATDPPPLARLVDDPADLTTQPARWQALLAAEHPAAIRLLLAVLDTDGSAKAAALQLWRRACVLSVPQPVVGEPPAILRQLLGG